MNQGKKAMDLLLVLVAEHYKLEESYGRELKKILKKVEEFQEIGYVVYKKKKNYALKTLLIFFNVICTPLL